MNACSICGGPITPADRGETHHNDHSKDDADPDNLRDVHRRCHMHHHENDRATDGTERYAPNAPRTPFTPERSASVGRGEGTAHNHRHGPRRG